MKELGSDQTRVVESGVQVGYTSLRMEVKLHNMGRGTHGTEYQGPARKGGQDSSRGGVKEVDMGWGWVVESRIVWDIGGGALYKEGCERVGSCDEGPEGRVRLFVGGGGGRQRVMDRDAMGRQESVDGGGMDEGG
eukprot:675729-Hanusia_phi.AAC.2